MYYTVLGGSFLAVAFASLILAAEPAPPAGGVREIDVQGLKLGAAPARPNTPVEMRSAEELAKAVTEAEAQMKIGAAVDFAKEKLVLFHWSGSGQDKISVGQETADGKTVVVFTYQPGRTRDLRPHQRLFALPSGMPWKVGVGRP